MLSPASAVRVLLFGVGLLLFAGCPAGEESGDRLEGTVRVDGSSTVYPVMEASAEEYRKEEPRVRVTVGVSGTGGGFKKFLLGETDLNNASRPIKPSEQKRAEKKKIEYIELPIAYDGLTVIVNPENDWVDHLTVEELKRIWQPESTVGTWKDIRSEWPDEEIHLYAPGPDSGTFDYFTHAIVGEAGASRADYTASEDDNVLVQGVSGDRSALGYLGFAYYAENTSRLKAVPIAGGEGPPVAPSSKTIQDGTYTPLSRPLFIYVRKKAAERPAVDSFAKFCIRTASTLVSEVGYVALSDKVYGMVLKRYEERKTGTLFGKKGTTGVGIESVLASD